MKAVETTATRRAKKPPQRNTDLRLYPGTPSKVGIRDHLREIAPVPSSIQIPDVGSLDQCPDDQLWTWASAADEELHSVETTINRKETYVTEVRWWRGRILIEIKRRVGHGQFLSALKAHRIKSQRASEDMRIAEFYPSREQAGRVRVVDALKAIKKSEISYGPFENCFATPEWLRNAITRDYGFPGLDVASSHGVHFGERFYTPEEDGLTQDWVRDSRGKAVWMNCPYNKTVLDQWVTYAYQQSQLGCTVICLLPYWRRHEWFKLLRDYAEVRLPRDRVILDGFGPKEGKQCGNIPPREYESLIAIFRGSTGFRVAQKRQSVCSPRIF
jgi:hypothetical protein